MRRGSTRSSLDQMRSTTSTDYEVDVLQLEAPELYLLQ